MMQPTQKGMTIWFTGLPCSGKTTLAKVLLSRLTQLGHDCEFLDGDLTRPFISSTLGFSTADRNENIRRIGYIASLLTKHGVTVIASFVSPYRAIRQEIRAQIGAFFEIYVRCPVEKCIARDVKGMYQRALNGEIANFTGISDPYEEPLQPEVMVDTQTEDEATCVQRILTKLTEIGFISPR